MPRSIASASSRAHIIGRTTATLEFTTNPAGTQRSEARMALYSSTHSFLFRLDEGEAQRADAPLRREPDRLAPRACDPQRRVRLLQRLGDDVPRGHRDEPAV